MFTCAVFILRSRGRPSLPLRKEGRKEGDEGRRRRKEIKEGDKERRRRKKIKDGNKGRK
jgi:hypothetical protein